MIVMMLILVVAVVVFVCLLYPWVSIISNINSKRTTTVQKDQSVGQAEQSPKIQKVALQPGDFKLSQSVLNLLKENPGKAYSAADVIKCLQTSDDQVATRVLRHLAGEGTLVIENKDGKDWYIYPTKEMKDPKKNEELHYINEPLPFVDEKAIRKKQRKRRIIVGTILSIPLIAVAIVLTINQVKINNAVGQLSENLKGKTFEDIDFHNNLKLYDPVNGRNYEFQGAKSTFIFNDDGTLTWIRQYVRPGDRKTLTRAIATTESYTVKYTGGLIFDGSKMCLSLSSGDTLAVGYKDEFVPTGANYSYLNEATYYAPEELMHIDTSRSSYIQGNSSSTYASSHSSSSSRTKCSFCNGTGYVKYYYGGSKLEAILAGQPDYTTGPCTLCKGTGYK